MEESISSRRLFIAKTSLAVVGTTLLTSTSSFATIIGNNSPFQDYLPISGFKNDLRSPFSEKSIEVSGTIFSSQNNLKPATNATIEVWHLSPNSKKFNHRGKFETNDNGHYSFWTDFPNRKKGQIPRIFFKVTSNGKITYTELLVTNFRAHVTHRHWEENRFLKEKLFPTYKTSKEETEIQFNFIIN